MNSIGKEIKNGIRMAMAALLLIWKDLYLLVFLSVPLFARLFFDLLLLTIGPAILHWYDSLHLLPALTAINIHLLVGIILLFVKIFIELIFMGALIIYCAQELKGHRIHFKNAFLKLRTHMQALFFWSIILLIEALLTQTIFSDNQVPIRLASLLLVTIWYLASWLVVPLIVLEHISIRRALIGSFILVRQKIWLVLSGVALLILLSNLSPLSFFTLNYYFSFHWSSLTIISSIIISIMIKSYILTAENIFKTMTYKSFFDKKN